MVSADTVHSEPMHSDYDRSTNVDFDVVEPLEGHSGLDPSGVKLADIERYNMGCSVEASSHTVHSDIERFDPHLLAAFDVVPCRSGSDPSDLGEVCDLKHLDTEYSDKEHSDYDCCLLVALELLVAWRSGLEPPEVDPSDSAFSALQPFDMEYYEAKHFDLLCNLS